MKYKVLKDKTIDKVTGKTYNEGDTIDLPKERGEVGVKRGRLAEIKPKKTKSKSQKISEETIKK